MNEIDTTPVSLNRYALCFFETITAVVIAIETIVSIRIRLTSVYYVSIYMSYNSSSLHHGHQFLIWDGKMTPFKSI